MYNNIGLTTPRGSGTNGYVTRNLSFVRDQKERVSYKPDVDLAKFEATMTKKPNKEILEHERKRQIEVECTKLQDTLEEQGYVLSYPSINAITSENLTHVLKLFFQNVVLIVATCFTSFSC